MIVHLAKVADFHPSLLVLSFLYEIKKNNFTEDSAQCYSPSVSQTIKLNKIFQKKTTLYVIKSSQSVAEKFPMFFSSKRALNCK